jgi:hypothetical protein
MSRASGFLAGNGRRRRLKMTIRKSSNKLQDTSSAVPFYQRELDSSLEGLRIEDLKRQSG